MRRGVRLLAASCLVALLAGCTPSPAPPPSPTPTSSPRPEDPLERQRRLDFAAAQSAYRAFSAEMDRVLIAGGAREPTSIMTKTAGGEVLKVNSRVVLAYLKTGSRQVGTTSIVRLTDQAYSTTELLLEACLDGRGVKAFTKKKLVATDTLRKVELTMRKDAGVWKNFRGRVMEEGACSS